MGEVYRARDPKLNREDAIKVLPPALANDADYLTRFQHEAQALAALNHPNIAAIYGLENNAIIMELVEGDTLRGPIPLKEVLPIARQIAEALEAAHDKGIIHRDLKPANIKLTPEGVIKVLDFGLAKSVERSTISDTNSPTLSMRSTEAGMILGTAAYMSPEQAAGKPVDRRADIWSFGVVIYELIAGKRLFKGETTSHTLADVLRADIDFTEIPAGPARELMRRCLDRTSKAASPASAKHATSSTTPEHSPQYPQKQTTGRGQSPPVSQLHSWLSASASRRRSCRCESLRLIPQRRPLSERPLSRRTASYWPSRPSPKASGNSGCVR